MQLWVEENEDVEVLEELFSGVKLLYQYIERGAALEDILAEAESLHNVVANCPKLLKLKVDVPYLNTGLSDAKFDWD